MKNPPPPPTGRKPSQTSAEAEALERLQFRSLNPAKKRPSGVSSQGREGALYRPVRSTSWIPPVAPGVQKPKNAPHRGRVQLPQDLVIESLTVEAALKKAQAESRVVPQPELESRQEIRVPGYLFRRLMAWFSDVLLGSTLMSVGLLLWVHYAPEEVAELGFPLTWDSLLMGAVLSFQMVWLGQLVSETLFRLSVGKALFGLRIRGRWTQRFARVSLFPISFLPLGLGLLRLLWARDRQAWQDRWSDASVIGIEEL